MGRERINRCYYNNHSCASFTTGGGSGEGGGSMNMDMEEMVKPAWLEGLMGETFFGDCGIHENRRKNEKNIFCLNCCLSICPHCLPSHRSHPLLQVVVVRRYVYHDVVRLDELEKLIDCSYIQPYTINSAKVIFLKQRPQSRSCKGSANNFCFTCDRILQDPFHFCSLSCKVDHLVYQGEDLSSIIYRFNESDFEFSEFEGLRMDGSEIAEDDGRITSSSTLEDTLQCRGSNDTMANSGISHEQQRRCTIPKGKGKGKGKEKEKEKEKEKKGSGLLPGIVLSLGRRRKSAPHRAPLS